MEALGRSRMELPTWLNTADSMQPIRPKRTRYTSRRKCLQLPAASWKYRTSQPQQYTTLEHSNISRLQMFYTARSLPVASASPSREACQHGCPLCLHWFLNASILHFIQLILRHTGMSVSPFIICQQTCYREGNILSDQAQNIWKAEISQSLAMKQAPKEQNWPFP